MNTLIKTKKISALFLAATLIFSVAACGSDSSESADRQDAVDTYAAGVHASYAASLASAQVMHQAIDAFVANPTASNLDDAKNAWLIARSDYGPTEAFRFYGGPIDNDETGTEGLINAWPLDEGYIDYVDGNADAGIINQPGEYPTIDADLLISLNEDGGEANISTGWHAIEFLLWGQDLSLTGAGARPVDDYTSNANADRRGAYLMVASELLVQHLSELVSAWDSNGSNYRSEFVAQSTDESLRQIITGFGELSRGELAGERMNVAYSERSQEDEHSCFSDNTTNDIIGNARGIEMVLTAQYPNGVTGTSILDVIASEDNALATQLETEVTTSMNAVRSIPAPFDQHLVEGVSDSSPGRTAILNAMTALENQTDTIVAAANAIGVSIEVS
tara:strand:+ start:374 stop:1546 length:1173 start_codon:yes stop_codon:yes gene_type:complete